MKRWITFYIVCKTTPCDHDIITVGDKGKAHISICTLIVIYKDKLTENIYVNAFWQWLLTEISSVVASENVKTYSSGHPPNKDRVKTDVE